VERESDMKFMLEITEMDNAEFEEDGHNFTVARILVAAAKRIQDGHLDAGILYDINGNKVGRYITTD
jgi:hypothetical protein